MNDRGLALAVHEVFLSHDGADLQSQGHAVRLLFSADP